MHLSTWRGLWFHSVRVRSVKKCVPVIWATCAKTLETLWIEPIFITVCNPVLSEHRLWLTIDRVVPQDPRLRLQSIKSQRSSVSPSQNHHQVSGVEQQALLLPSNRSFVQSHPGPFSSNLSLSSGSVQAQGQTNVESAYSILCVGCIARGPPGWGFCLPFLVGEDVGRMN